MFFTSFMLTSVDEEFEQLMSKRSTERCLYTVFGVHLAVKGGGFTRPFSSVDLIMHSAGHPSARGYILRQNILCCRPRPSKTYAISIAKGGYSISLSVSLRVTLNQALMILLVYFLLLCCRYCRCCFFFNAT